MYMSQMCPARIIGTSIFTPTKLLKINKIILKSNLNKLKPSQLADYIHISKVTRLTRKKTATYKFVI